MGGKLPKAQHHFFLIVVHVSNGAFSNIKIDVVLSWWNEGCVGVCSVQTSRSENVEDSTMPWRLLTSWAITQGRS